jgi:hypothetical protein
MSKMDPIKVKILDQITTPYDDVIPSVEDPAAKFYTDVFRIYLGLYSNSITMDEAVIASEELKENPEFARHPVNPTYYAINAVYFDKAIENLRTLNKYKMFTPDAIRSALSFAFLIDFAPVPYNDLHVLKHLALEPLATGRRMSSIIGIAQNTALAAIERLKQKNNIRFSCHDDNTAFGLERILVFFELRRSSDWQMLENIFVSYPFMKVFSKPVNANVGYVGFAIPSDVLSIQKSSIRSVLGPYFKRLSIHNLETIGSTSNLSLFDGNDWNYPEQLESCLENGEFPNQTGQIKRMEFKGLLDNLRPLDFAVSSHLVLDSRRGPKELCSVLRRKGWDVSRGQVANSFRKTFEKELILPFLYTPGIGLPANFCFEIICDSKRSEQILSALSLTPITVYSISDRGLIIWVSMPGQHQADYYNQIANLVNLSDVESVQPIITVGRRGSRGIMDMVKQCEWKGGRWTTLRDVVDFESYINPDIIPY